MKRSCLSEITNMHDYNHASFILAIETFFLKVKRLITQHYSLLLLLLSLNLISSCQRDNPDEPNNDTNFSCSTDSINFASDKDAKLIVINASNDWTISSDAQWVSFSATSGKGKTGILVGATPNSSFERTATLTLTSGGKTHKITLKQSGASVIELTLNNVKFKMILVTGSTFVMGESTNNYPAHNVKLSDYYISETEVTNGLWKAIMGSLPYDKLEKYAGHDQHNQPNLPVTAISWNDITDTFLPALKTATGRDFRLPTEAEWEFAAMGGIKSKGYDFAGSNIMDEVGWFDENSSGSKKDVMLKEPNELGLYDMSGNAGEWCSDWYEYSYSWTEPCINPKGPATGTHRIVRGGNYNSATGWFGYHECKVKQRLYIKPSGYEDNGNPDGPSYFKCDPIGFRLAISL